MAEPEKEMRVVVGVKDEQTGFSFTNDFGTVKEGDIDEYADIFAGWLKEHLHLRFSNPEQFNKQS